MEMYYINDFVIYTLKYSESNMIGSILYFIICFYNSICNHMCADLWSRQDQFEYIGYNTCHRFCTHFAHLLFLFPKHMFTKWKVTDEVFPSGSWNWRRKRPRIWANAMLGKKRCKGNENQTINVYFNASLVAYNGFKSVLVYTAFSYRECNIYSMM